MLSFEQIVEIQKLVRIYHRENYELDELVQTKDLTQLSSQQAETLKDWLLEGTDRQQSINLALNALENLLDINSDERSLQ